MSSLWPAGGGGALTMSKLSTNLPRRLLHLPLHWPNLEQGIYWAGYILPILALSDGRYLGRWYTTHDTRYMTLDTTLDRDTHWYHLCSQFWNICINCTSRWMILDTWHMTLDTTLDTTHDRQTHTGIIRAVSYEISVLIALQDEWYLTLDTWHSILDRHTLVSFLQSIVTLLYWLCFEKEDIMADDT